MNEIIDAVEKIRLLPGTDVDAGFRQGRDAILFQLKEEIWQGQNENILVDLCIKDMKLAIEELIDSAEPYEIPRNYIFFLEHYGGLAINHDLFYFSTLGIGPLVEVNYSSTSSDEAFHEVGKYGFLAVGHLSFRGGKYIYRRLFFFLDLARTIQKDAIICVGPTGNPNTVIKDVHSYPTAWEITANSF
ncbi:MAG: hypothetical protein IAF02_25335, partial [Anaerolineae bacterium]|nr:hypothetical protein [Anaerolineae bacterium]